MAEPTQEHLDKMDKAAELVIKALDESMRVDDEINLAADTGTNNLQFKRVEAGRELMLQHLSGYNDTSAPTRIRVGYWNGHRLNWLNTQPAPLTTEVVSYNGAIRLREGMYPIVRFEGVTALDDLYATLNGYWIKIK